MKATRITPTTYSVTADSLSCNRPGCGFVTRSARHRIGDGCPRCEQNLNVKYWVGKLERSSYHCDLEEFTQVGACACWHFEKRLAPRLRNMSPQERRETPLRCKHCEAARREAKKDENFDAILAMLPNQEKQI